MRLNQNDMGLQCQRFGAITDTGIRFCWITNFATQNMGHTMNMQMPDSPNR